MISDSSLRNLANNRDDLGPTGRRNGLWSRDYT